MSAVKTTGMDIEDGVWISWAAKEKFGQFEEAYFHIREKEQRIFTINEIRQLPQVPVPHPHAREWAKRAGSIDRFIGHLKNRQPKPAKVLDLGCGNGFFAHLVSGYVQQVVGIDVNLTELKQAARAFADNPKLKWYYLDIFEEGILAADFDLVTFCCSFQYFQDLDKILYKCMQLLKPGGSVHIIDTPFYADHDIARAKTASADYYEKLGFAELAQHYHHHSWSEIQPYHPVVHYRPVTSFFSSLSGKKKSPFPWIEIIKQ